MAATLPRTGSSAFDSDDERASDHPPRHADLDGRALLAHAIARDEGDLTATGALAVTTGAFTGRSPKDKYIVEEPSSRDEIWWGEVNQPMTEARFDALLSDVEAHLGARETWAQHLAVGADPEYRYPVDLVTERA